VPVEATAEPDELYRLELLSETAVAQTTGNISRLQVHHARASHLAEVLEMLLPGLGRGGTEQRYYLLYESKTVWSLAAHFAALLDAEPVDPGTVTAASTPEATFAAGVGLILSSRRLSTEQVRRAETLLVAVAQAESAERSMRWASAMLAGRLLSEARFERFDFDGATEHFLIAQSYSQPTSFPQMVAVLARADMHQQIGQAGEAQKLRVRVMNEYANHADTNVYRRIRKELVEGSDER
jgi:hypothetical protein